MAVLDLPNRKRASTRSSNLALIRKHWTDYLFIAPSFLGVLAFIVFPMIFALIISFTEWDILRAPKVVGLQNYVDLFTRDNLFWVSLRNSAVYVLLTVTSGIVASLGLALLMNQKVKGIGLFKVAMFIPVVTPAVAVAFIWSWIYNSDIGLLNAGLVALGLPKIGWLTDPGMAMISLAILGVWKSAGYYAIIFLAALQDVPDVYYEAAAIDGATAWQKFWKITLPLITPAILFVIIIAVIGSFQVFDQVYLMTNNGGPGTATYVYNLHLYNNAFRHFRMGTGAAMAYVLFGILFVVTYLQFRLGRRRTAETYDFG